MRRVKDQDNWDAIKRAGLHAVQDGRLTGIDKDNFLAAIKEPDKTGFFRQLGGGAWNALAEQLIAGEPDIMGRSSSPLAMELPAPEGALGTSGRWIGSAAALIAEIALLKKFGGANFKGFIGDMAAAQIAGGTQLAGLTAASHVINRLPMPTAVKLLAEAGLFSGVTAVEGGNKYEVALNALMPLALKAAGIGKDSLGKRWSEATTPEAKAQVVKEVQALAEGLEAKPAEPLKAEGGQPPPAATVDKLTSMKNAWVDQERAARGLEPMEPALREKWGEAIDTAGREMEANPGRAAELVADVMKKPRAVTAPAAASRKIRSGTGTRNVTAAKAAMRWANRSTAR